MPPKKLGSSPQVRGKRVFHTGTYNVRRLIPAGAGKTIIQCVDELDYAAHPRRCGENINRECRRTRRHGSSPQVRGKLDGRLNRRRRIWLIPAGAGKTCENDSMLTRRAAHPRRCGENPPAPAWMDFVTGSSPQVRGKLNRTV